MTCAPAAAAISLVPSAEFASTTKTCPASIDSTIGPMVSAHSLAGITTETAERSRSPKSVWSKLRISGALSSQADGEDPIPDALVRHPRGGARRRASCQDRALRRPSGQARAGAGLPQPGAPGGARAHRRRQTVVTPGRGARVGVEEADDRHDRYREREIAGVQPAGAGHAGARPPRACDLHLPDEGARPGPGAQAPRAARALPSPRDLRRRHAARGAPGDPSAL